MPSAVPWSHKKRRPAFRRAAFLGLGCLHRSRFRRRWPDLRFAQLQPVVGSDFLFDQEVPAPIPIEEGRTDFLPGAVLANAVEHLVRLFLCVPCFFSLLLVSPEFRRAT